MAILLILGLIWFLLLGRKDIIHNLNKGYMDAQIVYDNHKKLENSKKHRSIKIASNILVDFLLVSLGAVLLLGLSDRFLNTSITPYKSVVVPTESMSYKNKKNEYLFENKLNNQIQPGDLVFLKKVKKLDDIKLYDVICYKNKKNVQIIHRVVEIHDGYVNTRGDINDSNDDMNITFDRIVGKYTNGRIPKVGDFVYFISSNYGILAFASIFIMLLSYWTIRDNTMKYEDKRIKYLIDQINDETTFKIESKGGVLTVKDNVYEFLEHDEKLQVDMTSTLVLSDEKVINLKQEGVEDKDEKEAH